MVVVVQALSGIVGFRLLVQSISSRSTSWRMPPRVAAFIEHLSRSVGLAPPDELAVAASALLGRGFADKTSCRQVVGGGFAICAGALLLGWLGAWFLAPAVFCIFCGTRLPVLFLRARVAAARNAALAGAPRALEALATLLASGLSGEVSVAQMAASTSGSWLSIWQRSLVGIRTGSAAPDALQQVVGDAGLIQLLPVVNSWRRAIQLGHPSAGQLFNAASGLRAAENAARLRRAGRVGPMATLIIAMVIAPATVACLATLLVAGIAGQGLVR